MLIQDCFKDYHDRAISKVIPPERTCAVILKKLNHSRPFILENYFDVQSQFRSPHEIRLFCMANLALCYRAIGEIDRAIGFLVTVYDKNPSFSFTVLCNYFSIGLTARQTGLFNQTYDLYRSIRTLRERFPGKKPAEIAKIMSYIKRTKR